MEVGKDVAGLRWLRMAESQYKAFFLGGYNYNPEGPNKEKPRGSMSERWPPTSLDTQEGVGRSC